MSEKEVRHSVHYKRSYLNSHIWDTEREIRSNHFRIKILGQKLEKNLLCTFRLSEDGPQRPEKNRMRVSFQGERRKTVRPGVRGGGCREIGIPTATVDLFNGIQNEAWKLSSIP